MELQYNKERVLSILEQIEQTLKTIKERTKDIK